MRSNLPPPRAPRGTGLLHARACRAAAVGALAFALSSRAFALDVPPPKEVVGSVVAIDDGDIVLDVGTDRGATAGDVVELWRPLRIRHPVTGKMLTDRFRIGALVLVQVRPTLSLAHPRGDLARPAAAGDVIVLERSATLAPPSAGAAVGPGSTGSVDEAAPTTAPEHDGESAPRPEARASDDRESADLGRLFDALRGKDPATRVAHYEAWIRMHPSSRFVGVLWEEVQALRALLSSATRREASEPAMRWFLPPSEAIAGRPLELGFETNGTFRGAVVHVRHAGEVAYGSLPMRGAGAGYFDATLPAAELKAPNVEYFVEAIDDRGRAVPMIGTADTPESLVVHELPRPEAPPVGEATVSLLTDYADWNRLSAKQRDSTWQTEGWFGLRLRDVGVRAVRSGFGVYRGVGGSLRDLDELHKTPREVGLTYGWLEGEFALSHFTALVGRAVVGLGDDGVSGGGQMLLRLGNDKETNLLLGGEVLGGIGLRTVAELDWNTFPRVPIVLRTEVTNQPAGAAVSRPRPSDGTSSFADTASEQGEFGARAIVQVGYRIVPELTLSLRTSYEGRTIHHAGPGAGAGVTYTW